MFLFIEPISRNIGMYVPAYPLPVMEVAGYVQSHLPEAEIKILSIPMDYGLPLNREGKNHVYDKLTKDITRMNPLGIGISCTSISQSEEVMILCDLIKEHLPDTCIFLGGYFPTLYYEEIFCMTPSVDLIVTGEGEVPALRIIECLIKGENPKTDRTPNLVWKNNGRLRKTKKGSRFNLTRKAPLDLNLLKNPGAYEVLPYAFSRGCPYKCNFCMEDYIRPSRRKVPVKTIEKDLETIATRSNTRTLVVSDALFNSFELFPLLRSLGLTVNFETRCDVLDPSVLPDVADVCGAVALGFESASYGSLRRMNKVRSRSHFDHYIANTKAIFKEAVRNEIPVMVFMIAGYPGDTEKDLEKSLAFAEELSKFSGPGGHVFKIGECHVYPKTKIFDLAQSLPQVSFDNDGVFGQNIIRQSSRNLKFDTILSYSKKIYTLSNRTLKLEKALYRIMPFFRLPVRSLSDDLILDKCFKDSNRNVLNVTDKSLSTFKKSLPDLVIKYRTAMAGSRKSRSLDL